MNNLEQNRNSMLIDDSGKDELCEILEDFSSMSLFLVDVFCKTDFEELGFVDVKDFVTNFKSQLLNSGIHPDFLNRALFDPENTGILQFKTLILILNNLENKYNMRDYDKYFEELMYKKNH